MYILVFITFLFIFILFSFVFVGAKVRKKVEITKNYPNFFISIYSIFVYLCIVVLVFDGFSHEFGLLPTLLNIFPCASHCGAIAMVSVIPVNGINLCLTFDCSHCASSSCWCKGTKKNWNNQRLSQLFFIIHL